MPISLTPPPADNEIECANCGAYVYIELSRCPHCGINLYEPEAELEKRDTFRPKSKFSRSVEALLRWIRREPDPAEELFNAFWQEKALFDDLLLKVGGDRSAAERLIAFERQQTPNATRTTCLKSAIRHWERENLP
jgi:hypothetical protein